MAKKRSARSADSESQTRPGSWLTRRQLADAIGISVNVFDREVRRLIDEDDPAVMRRENRGHIKFFAPSLLAAWGKWKFSTPSEQATPQQQPLDPAIRAAASYRREKARIARIERMKLEGRLVDRDRMEVILHRMSSFLRDAGRHLQVKCGPLAHEILSDALDSFERELRLHFETEHRK